MTVHCGCCGTAVTSTDRIDFKLNRPEPLIGVDATQLAEPTGGLMTGPDGEAYLRCLLPVRLTGGVELVFSAWMQVPDSTAMRAYHVWEDGEEYAKFTASGTFANVIMPWPELMGVPVEAAVRDADELPYYTSHPLLDREWDRDFVLSRIQHPLPVPVRETLTGWSVERSAGMRNTVEERSTVFAGGGRWVQLDEYGDRAGRSVDDFLAVVTAGYPIGEHTVDRSGDELRHAFWLTEQHDDITLQVFHAHVVRPGTMLSVRCMYIDPADRAWAHHVVNSVQHL